ncbi:hypothetical protein RD055328_03170 [Companilactobacillus sp. RD055328]|uniref:helix-turn-helix domain-containing protein n=1 Tax=Companilactobacillus sp. RD055328 TaxID=2916634 RepID=UPI001FC81200|nr:helix-turn-helix transcriptional regulator [Companilactobacillus sp. RD055328]GKQ42394.1 hypothetical protein RD055328_03170 [Companilactobacillus sp. RD055328]
MSTFSDQLINLRTKRGLSQEQLADKLYVSRQAVSKWEKADSTPDLDKVIQIAKILDVSLDELVLGIAQKEVKPGTSGWYKVNNGYEFIAKFWWIPIALIWSIFGMLHQFK